LSRPAGCSFLAQEPLGIFTPENFSSEEKLMIDTAAEFDKKEVLPLLDRLDQQEDGLMPGLIHKAGELGLCGVDTPEEYGGLGLGKNVSARILEMMSFNGSFAVTYGITSGISQVGLNLFGTEAQKKKYLPKVASGEWIGAYALSEPNSGSDALSASTRAEKRGDTYVLNGTKMWISNAKWADLFLVMARVDGERFSAFLVERDFPGVNVDREEHKMGLKGSSTARLLLEEAVVPAGNLLHQEGLGHHVAFNALNIGRFKLASMSIGPCRDAMGLAARYALDRKQFGQPIANFGLIRKKFAQMAAQFYAAESMIYRTGANIDGAFEEWGGTIDGNRKAAEEYSIECSACKVFATEAQAFIVDEALQTFGGYGFTEEFPIARHYRDARVSRIYEGTNEINRLFIADRFLKRVADGRVSAAAFGGSFVGELASRAISKMSTDQVSVGAVSDLLLLTYAEQSARIRASQNPGWNESLYGVFAPWCEARAAELYREVTGQEICLGARASANLDAVGERAIELAAMQLG
jgi:alkylation response protein AidB-like acyl-CoA dehydrogenase